MGKTKGPYKAEFAVGSMVRIADIDFLKDFPRQSRLRFPEQVFPEGWQLHHPPEPEQLMYAGRDGEVIFCYYYHGGDELYELKEIPGLWHEWCLQAL